MEISSPPRVIIRLALSLFSVMLFFAQQKVVAANDHWVTTWGCGPQLTEPGNLPPVPLANTTLRQFVHVSIGGNHLRVRFSNTYGTNPVTIQSVHVALAPGTDSAANGIINPPTDKALTFDGAPSASIPPGEAVYSDPFDFNLPALTNLAITIYFGNISATTINGHPGSRTTSYIQSGNAVSSASLPTARTIAHWYIITGVEVLADSSSKAIVVLGDSITDGRGSTTDGNNRWPDDLAQRLNTNPPTANVAVVNMGIGGNGIFGGLGPSALKRFDRDVLDQNGVRWMIVFEGVNDIGGGRTETAITNALVEFVDKAHTRNLLAYGATITPFGRSFYDTPAHEAARQAVNNWIRTSGKFEFRLRFRRPFAPESGGLSRDGRCDSFKSVYAVTK
jgi:lysophospholipase L1-like esterase